VAYNQISLHVSRVRRIGVFGIPGYFMKRKAGTLFGLIVFMSFRLVVHGQDFINQEDALVWIGKNIESSTTVPIRKQSEFRAYEYGNDIRFFKLAQINGCKLILERYDKEEGKPMIKSVYELPMTEIDPSNIRMAVEKYSRNICLILQPNNQKKIKVIRLSGKDFKNKRYLKKTEVILEFNQEAQEKNIPSQMRRAFQYTVQKCNNDNSSLIDYLNNSMN
jgi:hypothetical protein